MEGALASVVEAMAPYAASPAESRDQELKMKMKELLSARSSKLNRIIRKWQPPPPTYVAVPELVDNVLVRRGNRRADILYMRMRVKKAEDVLVGRKRVEWLKRHGIPPPPPALTGQQKLEIEECFRLLDEDGSGGLDADELYEAFHDLGFRPNRREILDVLREMDTEGRGVLEFEDFMDIMSRQLNAQVEVQVNEHLQHRQSHANLLSHGDMDFSSAVRAFRRSKLIEKYMAGGQARSEVVDLLMENKRQQMREEEQRLKESRTELAETPAAKMALKWRRLAAGSTRAREAQKTHPGWSAVSRLSDMTHRKWLALLGKSNDVDKSMKALLARLDQGRFLREMLERTVAYIMHRDSLRRASTSPDARIRATASVSDLGGGAARTWAATDGEREELSKAGMTSYSAVDVFPSAPSTAPAHATSSARPTAKATPPLPHQASGPQSRLAKGAGPADAGARPGHRPGPASDSMWDIALAEGDTVEGASEEGAPAEGEASLAGMEGSALEPSRRSHMRSSPGHASRALQARRQASAPHPGPGTAQARAESALVLDADDSEAEAHSPWPSPERSRPLAGAPDPRDPSRTIPPIPSSIALLHDADAGARPAVLSYLPRGAKPFRPQMTNRQRRGLRVEVRGEEGRRRREARPRDLEVAHEVSSSSFLTVHGAAEAGDVSEEDGDVGRDTPGPTTPPSPENAVGVTTTVGRPSLALSATDVPRKASEAPRVIAGAATVGGAVGGAATRAMSGAAGSVERAQSKPGVDKSPERLRSAVSDAPGLAGPHTQPIVPPSVSRRILSEASIAPDSNEARVVTGAVVRRAPSRLSEANIIDASSEGPTRAQMLRKTGSRLSKASLDPGTLSPTPSRSQTASQEESVPAASASVPPPPPTLRGPSFIRADAARLGLSATATASIQIQDPTGDVVHEESEGASAAEGGRRRKPRNQDGFDPDKRESDREKFIEIQRAVEEFSSRDWTSQNIDSAVWLGKAAFAHSVDTIDGYMECPPDLPPKVIEVLREPSNQDLFRQWSQIASTVQERRTVSRPVEPNYLASTQRSRQLSPPRTASPPHERSFSSSWAKAGALGMFLASLSGSGKAIGVGGAAEPGPAMPPEASAQAVGAPGAWPSPQRAGRASPVEAPGSPERGGPWRVARGFRSLDHAPGPLTTAQMAIINTPRRVTQPPFVTREELGLVAEEGSSEAANLDASALVSQAATWRRHRMAQVDERPGTPGDATASVAGPGSLSQRVRGGREGGRGKGGRSPDGRRRGLEGESSEATLCQDDSTAEATAQAIVKNLAHNALRRAGLVRPQVQANVSKRASLRMLLDALPKPEPSFTGLKAEASAGELPQIGPRKYGPTTHEGDGAAPAGPLPTELLESLKGEMERAFQNADHLSKMAREREELMAELVAGSISKATQVAVEEREDERARHPAGAQEAAKHVPESLAECKRKAMRPAVPEFRRTVERDRVAAITEARTLKARRMAHSHGP